MRGSLFTRFVAGALTALLLVCAVPVHAAGASEIPGGTLVQESADPTVDSAAGVIGSMVCGGGALLIRYNPAIGMNPYVLGATIAGCILMALDCF
jgi:uncharacterized membrane protein YphA (DoxX/SURF4 family)